MAIAPTIGAAIKDATPEVMHGYFWMSFFWVMLGVVGLVLNFWLYFEDMRHNNGVLNKVHVDD